MRKIIFGLIAFALAMSVTACRVGNYADKPSTTSKSQFKNSELFFAEIKSFEAHVIYQDDTASSNLQTALVNVPTHLLNTFSSPLYWNTLDNPAQTQIFIEPSLTEYEQTRVNADGSIQVEIDSAVKPFLTRSDCRTQIQILQEGRLDRTQPGSSILPGADERSPVAGKLKLDYTYIQAFSGNCADSLTELAACYQNGSGCSTEQLAEAHALFDLYVRGSGVLPIEKAHLIKGLAYILHFD